MPEIRGRGRMVATTPPPYPPEGEGVAEKIYFFFVDRVKFLFPFCWSMTLNTNEKKNVVLVYFYR